MTYTKPTPITEITTQQIHDIAQTVAASLMADLKKRMIAETQKALAEAGIRAPEGMEGYNLALMVSRHTVGDYGIDEATQKVAGAFMTGLTSVRSLERAVSRTGASS